MLSDTGCTEVLERLSQHCTAAIATRATSLLTRFFDAQQQEACKTYDPPPTFVFS